MVKGAQVVFAEVSVLERMGPVDFVSLGVMPQSYLCVICLSLCASILPCVLPARFFASTGLILNLAVISILSSYIPVMPHITHFPLLYRHSHVYISFLLMTLYDSSPLYISCITQFSTDWHVLSFNLHVYFYFAYVFIPGALTCLLTLLWHVYLPYLYK
jgi:hypothetical protein